LDKASVIDILRALVIAITLIALWLCLYWAGKSRSQSMLRKWAQENGFQLLTFEKRVILNTGPYKFWDRSLRQVVFFAKVRDRNGMEKICWIRCGSFWGGIFFSNEVEARWD
jgi:hypothetical protein